MRRLWLLLVVVLLAPVACDRGDGKSDGDGGGQPRRGGSFRLGVTPVPSLDPAQARSVEQVLVADQLFDGLSAYDPKTLQAVPAVAERWEASADQKQWDFFLRADATFSNGRAIGPPDVKYTLDRIAKQGSGSPATDQLELVSGYARFAVEATAGDLPGVTVGPAPNQVHISLDQPQAELPSVLGSPLFGIVAREAVEAPAPVFAEAPVGSGPFTFGNRQGDTITLVKAPGSRAYVDRLQVVQFDTAAASYEAYRDGELDWTRVPPEQVDEALEEYGRNATRPYTAVIFYGFNLKSPRFADVRFREAIVHAVNRRAILSAVYGNTVLPLDGVVGQGVPGHQDDPCGERCKYDPERARELVAELKAAGIDPGEVQLDFDEDVTQTAVAQSIQANLQAAGIPARLRPRPLKEHQDFSVSGQQELFRLGWIAAYPAADAFLTPLFLNVSRSNLTGFNAAGVDDLLRQARSNPDLQARLELYRRAEREIMGHVPILPIAQFQVQAVTSTRVRGLTPTSFGTFDALRVADRRRLGAALAAALLLAAGCSGGDDGPDRSGGRTGRPTNSTTGPEPDRPRGGTARVGVWGDPDPAAPTIAGAGVRALVLPQLFVAQPDGTWKPSLLAPGSDRMAPDRLSASFRLRAGAAWSDGRPVTADDLRRSADARFVAGIDGPAAGGVVTVRFTQPLPGWQRLWSGADAVGAPAPDVWGGPFVVAGRTPGLETVLRRNDRWNGSKGPFLDEVRLVLVPDAVTSRQLLAKGELDVVMPPAVTRRTAQLEGVEGVKVAGVERGGWWVGLFLRPDRLGDGVRRAVMETIDRPRFVGVLLRDEATVLNGFLGPEDAAWAPLNPGPASGLRGQVVDLAGQLEEPMTSLLQRAMQLRAAPVGGRYELRNTEADRIEGWLAEGAYAAAVAMTIDGPEPCWLCRWGSVDEGLARAADAGDRQAAAALEARLRDASLLLPLWRPRTVVAWRDGLDGVRPNGYARNAAWNAAEWWSERD